MYDGVDESYHMLRMANYVVTGGDEECLTGIYRKTKQTKIKKKRKK